MADHRLEQVRMAAIRKASTQDHFHNVDFKTNKNDKVSAQSREGTITKYCEEDCNKEIGPKNQ